jgi:dienelactone hydrolase
MPHFRTLLLSLAIAASSLTSAQTPVGSIKEGAWVHTADSLNAVAQNAQVVLPAKVTGNTVFTGPLKQVPATIDSKVKVPVIVFMHGSSGLSLAAIGQWQRWLASFGYASIAPDSFALAGRTTYQSPIDVASYERIHALRASEIAPTFAALQSQPWADMQRVVLAGTSEGSVPVARHDGGGFVAKIMYAWSCEKNYFVTEPKSVFDSKKPVLNVISTVDPFFSKANSWVGNADAQGHCGAALKGHPQASVLLIPDAPHTLIMFPAAQNATAGFLMQVLNALSQ